MLSPHATIFSEHDRQQVKTARVSGGFLTLPLCCSELKRVSLTIRPLSGDGKPVQAFTTQEAGPHWVCSWTARFQDQNGCSGLENKREQARFHSRHTERCARGSGSLADRTSAKQIL